MARQLSRASSIENRDFARKDEQKWKMDRREFVVMIQEVTVKNFQPTVQRT